MNATHHTQVFKSESRSRNTHWKVTGIPSLLPILCNSGEQTEKVTTDYNGSTES